MNRIYAQPDADRLVEAQQRAISREAALGPDHIETLHAQASVVSLLRRLCRDEEAAALERRVNPKLLPIRAEGMLRQAKVIEDRGGTPTSELTEAGDAYVKLGKLSDARQVYDRAIAGLQKDYHEKGVKTPLGESHHYSIPRAGIAEVDWLEGRLVEAEQGYGEAMGAWGSRG